MKTWKMTFVALVAILGLVGFVGCGGDGGGGGGDPDLEGTITISPNTDVQTGTELTATYSGSETVSYQWKKGSSNVGTDSNKYIPTEAGSYTVTVSAEGYNSKTSTAVTVTGSTIYTVTFNSNGGTTVADQTVTKDDKATEPNDPSKNSGYDCIFVGWYDLALENAFDFDTPITGDITLYAKWRLYEVGDTGPGGGKIFYYSEDGFTMTDDNSTVYYLEAAPADMPTMLVWASSGFTTTDITGTAEGIGTGRKNTALILATDTEAPAAKACKEYTNNGKTDWFLPSKDELNELYENRTSIGNLQTTDDNGNASYYWSSSQYSNGSAWSQGFTNGSKYGDYKSGTSCSVRVVRAF